MPSQKRQNSQNKIFIFLISAFVLIALYTAIITRPVDSKSQEDILVVVRKGASVTRIAKTLKSEGLIRSELAFKLISYQEGIVQSIQAGSFRVSPAQSTREIALTLTRGRLDSWITIPEGFRTEEIALLAKELFNIEEQDFLAAAEGMEGMLFPDTYLIPEGASAEQLVKILNTTYENKINPLRADITKSRLSEKQVISFAAIIERETLADEEKPVVAGILLKRYKNDWPLQVDATLQYIAGTEQDWWPTPTSADRNIKSSYNTYINIGLTPSPIANPGLSSIIAVIDPEISPYWFYIHDDEGIIHYAETLEDHNVNINKYLR